MNSQQFIITDFSSEMSLLDFSVLAFEQQTLLSSKRMIFKKIANKKHIFNNNLKFVRKFSNDYGMVHFAKIKKHIFTFDSVPHDIVFQMI